MSPEPPFSAVRTVHEYVSPAIGLVERAVAVRSPLLLVRRTQYPIPIVDERVLTSVFPFVPPAARVIAVVMRKGILRIAGPRPITLHAGQSALITGTDMPFARFESAEYFDIEWLPAHAFRMQTPHRLGDARASAIRAVERALDSLTASPIVTLNAGAALARSIGATPPRIDAQQFTPPTERDLVLARAFEEQLRDLSRSSTTVHQGDMAGKSPRQLQRIVSDFNRRYGINARGRRDTRNRWRLQRAMLLLSARDLPLTDVAREADYGSTNALARAFAILGLPAPAVLLRKPLSGAERCSC